ncbi:hypothetical protein [Chryseobacterium sp. LAM-KRS1]|uniref:hypothetical protein n=1 Tax=Chryseobacterium sp. LAM-KRS1 TaxID=2715754 RepID=UPI001557C821|nr:hypothetical protein [Chryseobacterium sp. LAM-KRS1]
MFDNNNKIFAYKIALKLDPYLVALFNLCYDVYIKLENITINQNDIEYATLLFSDDFYEQLGVNKSEYLEKDDDEKYTYTKDQFFDTLAVNLNSYYLKSDNFITKLNCSEHLLYFKDSSIVYSTIGNNKDTKEIFNNINNKFKSINVIAEILKYLNDQNLRESIQSISTIYEFNKNGQYIKILNSEILKPQLFNVRKEEVNFDLLDEEPFDINNVWVNFDNDLCKDLSFDSEKDEYYLVLDKESNKVVGLKVNDQILLKYNIDFSKYINDVFKNKYIWQLFKENLFKKRSQTLIHDSDLITDFKEKSREREFNKLLCNLQHNLYINKEIKIKRKYKPFFEEFIIVNKLDELTNFNFFLPDDKKEKELLGIYTENKIGSKYNLIHYLKHKDEKHLDSFVNSNPNIRTKEKVNILKAELSFYLVEKYYEDIIEEILLDLGLDFTSNVELSIKGVVKAEFDFVIFNNNRFYILEAKTTLSKDNVYETSKKYNEYIGQLKKVTNTELTDFRFLLTALLSNTNLDNYKHFFDSRESKYNTTRRGFKAIPYKFNLPFFNHQKLELECIAEPELLKLKEFIRKICQI